MSWADLRDGNPLKDTLATGGSIVGLFVRLPASDVVEVCAHAGCDFVIIDMEHAPASWERVAAMIVAAEAAGTTPLVRVTTGSRELISRALDAGAHGVVVPRVDGVEHARSCIAASRYGPDGTRGVASNRRSGFGARMGVDEFVTASNAATFVVLQVETVAAIDDIARMVALDHLDCVMVGISDLSVDLGVPGQWDSPELREQVDRVLAACEAAGVAFGIPVVSTAMARSYLAQGARVVAGGDVPLLAAGAKNFIDAVRSARD